MPDNKNAPADSNRILVKLRPTNALRAAESRVNLRPLHDTPQTKPSVFGVGDEPQWYLADMPDGAESPWDLAHGRVADQLGVAESDVIFAEPDIIHDVYEPTNKKIAGQTFAVGKNCDATPQDAKDGKAVGPDEFAWHLGDAYTQLGKARDAIEFTDRRTRIGHLDTGYYAKHVTTPENILHQLEKNFVKGDANPGSAEDPDNRAWPMDNSGHGTGTISILAGGKVSGKYFGGAPGADILPLRIADTVVLLRTSAFAQALHYAFVQGCDVVTMSMGGLPSRAWRETVDEAYLGGLCVAAAAGNNSHGAPTRNIVYPARYGRVIAVCGVMANNKPYDRLSTMEGNYGPDSRMTAAIATYTPNIPWAVYGCESIVRLNGEGTSAATPQVAAAVAIWFEKYKNELPRDWRRVEAVRRALFTSAKNKSVDPKRLGNGILQAFDALRVRPVLNLPQTKPDNDSFAFLRVLTGLGVVEAPPREQMFNLELAQRWLVNPELQKIVPDPDAVVRLGDTVLKRLMAAIIEDDGASLVLRRHVASRYPVVAGQSAPRTDRSKAVITEVLSACDVQPPLQNPSYRRLRVYAVDPSFSVRLETASVNEVTLKIPWEELEKGPVGDYVAVEDVDAAKKLYEPVDLNDPRLLAQDGWAPSEGNPQFHQQMVYAVAMKTIKHFESALGRPVLWRAKSKANKPYDDSIFVKRLVIHPHALRQANAFYSPEKVALEFGYFETIAQSTADQVPGSRVYACLSHDIISHETTHAILDGMHSRFNEPTNPDVLALHEGFADIVALLQHFTIPEVVESEISRTRGDIEAESIFGSLAVQFGQATGGRGALRDAIGRMEGDVWKRFAPDVSELSKRVTPHSRGAVLVAAVFDAFIAIYNARTADLLRIYTGGTGVLPGGAIHPDLVRRLADEAATSATHVLTMCIRALDYVPPVDVTFFEYLRAIITADFDLVSDDKLNYRVAFVEAFRRRGIYPTNLAEPTSDTPRTLSADTLRWQGLNQATRASSAKYRKHYGAVVDGLKRYADECLYLTDRHALFDVTREQRRLLHTQLKAAFKATPEFAKELGLDSTKKLEVHELRCAMHFSPNGRHVPQVVVALTQAVTMKADKRAGTPRYTFRGGSTLIVDLTVPEVKYRIVKHIDSAARQERTAAFVRDAAADPLRALFFSPDRREPFAALHALADDGV